MLITVLYVAIIFFTALQSLCTKFYTQKYGGVISFSFLRAVASLLSFIFIGIFHFTFHLPTLFWGGAFGLLLAISMYCGYKALKTGPISLTSPLVALSVVIPTLYGVCFLKDPLTLLKIFGFITLVLAIVFFNFPKKKKASNAPSENIANFRWAIYVLLTFLCNGFSSIIQVEHQRAFPKAYTAEFMIFAMLIVILVFFVALFFKKEHKTFLSAKGKGYAICTGLSTGLVNYLTILLVAFENSSVMYPIISVGTLLAAMFSGIFIFKEKQPITRIVGFLFGVATVVLLKI